MEETGFLKATIAFLFILAIACDCVARPDDTQVANDSENSGTTQRSRLIYKSRQGELNDSSDEVIVEHGIVINNRNIGEAKCKPGYIKINGKCWKTVTIKDNPT
ncbi:uncharacterized protein LOC143204799 [Rhynchophorus ferrugineus]|uniref:uncharacterized protein LOC143204799 n=1 Tax=Rhynchophorus ferrugineus TaxID=354439 RepID=UPI003FCC8CB4